MNEAAGNWVVPIFPEEEIPHILQAVMRSMEGLKKAEPHENETALTKRLRIRLRRDPQLRDRPVEIDREAVLDDDETGVEGRLDLRFLFSTGRRKPWPYFVIEAKRLHVSFDSGWKSLVSEYVTGHQGMMCFITGRYSRGLRSGAMLGYVFDGDVEKAARSISATLEKHRSLLKLDPPHRLTRSMRLGCGPAWETNHKLPYGRFTVFHLLCAI